MQVCPCVPLHWKFLRRSTRLYESQVLFREALCDSFNTPAAVDTLRELVSKTNVYINSRGRALNVGLVKNIAEWVGRMLRMFGLGEGENHEIGWGQLDESGGRANVCFKSLPCLDTGSLHFLVA